MEEQYKKLQEIIDAGVAVEDLMKHKGWEHISKLLDGMIEDTIGSKLNGRWKNGWACDRRYGEDKARDALKYRQALIDFHSNIYRFIDDMNKSREEYKKHKEEEEQQKNPSYTIPMKDTEYSAGDN